MSPVLIPGPYPEKRPAEVRRSGSEGDMYLRYVSPVFTRAELGIPGRGIPERGHVPLREKRYMSPVLIPGPNPRSLSREATGRSVAERLGRGHVPSVRVPGLYRAELGIPERGHVPLREKRYMSPPQRKGKRTASREAVHVPLLGGPRHKQNGWRCKARG